MYFGQTVNKTDECILLKNVCIIYNKHTINTDEALKTKKDKN